MRDAKNERRHAENAAAAPRRATRACADAATRAWREDSETHETPPDMFGSEASELEAGLLGFLPPFPSATRERGDRPVASRRGDEGAEGTRPDGVESTRVCVESRVWGVWSPSPSSDENATAFTVCFASNAFFENAANAKATRLRVARAATRVPATRVFFLAAEKARQARDARAKACRARRATNRRVETSVSFLCV